MCGGRTRSNDRRSEEKRYRGVLGVLAIVYGNLQTNPDRRRHHCVPLRALIMICIDSIEASLAKDGQICEASCIGIGALARTRDFNARRQSYGRPRKNLEQRPFREPRADDTNLLRHQLGAGHHSRCVAAISAGARVAGSIVIAPPGSTAIATARRRRTNTASARSYNRNYAQLVPLAARSPQFAWPDGPPIRRAESNKGNLRCLSLPNDYCRVAGQPPLSNPRPHGPAQFVGPLDRRLAPRMGCVANLTSPFDRSGEVATPIWGSGRGRREPQTGDRRRAASFRDTPNRGDRDAAAVLG
jgi:hypothetical protein